MQAVFLSSGVSYHFKDRGAPAVSCAQSRCPCECGRASVMGQHGPPSSVVSLCEGQRLGVCVSECVCVCVYECVCVYV